MAELVHLLGSNHGGIFMASRIIFLIAISMLNRKGLLQNIEINNATYYDDVEYGNEV